MEQTVDNDDFERRKSFRHNVKPPQEIIARIILDDGRKVEGMIVDLSMGGVAVLLNECIHSQCSSCSVRFRLPIAPLVFDLLASIIHCELNAEGIVWGLEFSNIEDRHKNLEHTVLYRFLVSAFQKQHPTLL